MGTLTIWKGVGFHICAVALLCAAGTVSCSRSSLGSSSARDGGVRDSVGAGGTTQDSTDSTGLSSSGGASGGRSEATTSAGGSAGLSTSKTSGGAGATTAGTSSQSSSKADGGSGGSSDSSRGGTVATSAAAGAGGTSSFLTGGGLASGGSATGGNRSDGGIVVTPDASARSDGRATDVLSYTDFGELIQGTWLAGWKDGDARHYSWVRLSGSWGGTAEYLSGSDLPSNTPLWPCSGQGSWFLTESYYSIMLRLPSTCPSGISSLFTFREFPDVANGPPGATFGMITMPLSSGQKAEWWRYPEDQCDAAMSACKNPF